MLRVLVLTCMLAAFVYCFSSALFLRSIYAGIASAIIIIELISYVDGFNRKIKTFLMGMVQHDFTMNFSEKEKGKSFQELYDTFNTITQTFRRIASEKEIQYRYLELLVAHLRVGIISYDSHERIHLANDTLKALLQRPIITNLDSIKAIDHELYETIKHLRTGETKLLKVPVGNTLLHLSLHASEFLLDEQYFKLISLQNIRNELDMQEMESWQKLIRVLTHEIMNSISPITSLSATLHGLISNHKPLLTSDPATFNILNQGLEAIKTRSEGLHHFTETYRQLTRIPKPSFKKTNIAELLQRIQLLFAPEFEEKKISFIVRTPKQIEVTLDGDLFEQVIINLLKNAIDAVSNQEKKRIEISASCYDGTFVLHVTDNGTGMDKTLQENIFIPFFTTKKNGSGIGLALVKQILQLHNARIQVQTEAGAGAKFIIMM